jgi:putative membrane protein
MRMLLLWLINALALAAVPYVVTSVVVTGFWSALIAALLLALVNVLLRPILILLTLPINILTL